MEGLLLLLLPLIPDPDLLKVQVLCSPHVVHCLLMVWQVDGQLAMSTEEVLPIWKVVHTLPLQVYKLSLSCDLTSSFHFKNQLQNRSVNQQIKAKSWTNQTIDSNFSII